MKFNLLLLACLYCCSGALNADDSQPAPTDVVKQRMHALNAHDFKRFMATYSKDVAVYVYPDRLLGKGKSHIKKIFGPMIAQGKIHVEVGRILSADSYVVVESRTSFGDTFESSVSIYEIREGLIHAVRFLRDDVKAQRQSTAKQDSCDD